MKQALIAVALLSLSLSGCGSASPPPPKSTPSATTSTLSEWDKQQAARLAKQAAAASAAASMTRFEKAVKSCPALPASVLADDGKTIMMSTKGKDYFPIADVVCPLVTLKMPTSITAKMDQTTSLMGMQSDSWDGIQNSRQGEFFHAVPVWFLTL